MEDVVILGWTYPAGVHFIDTPSTPEQIVQCCSAEYSGCPVPGFSALAGVEMLPIETLFMIHKLENHPEPKGHRLFPYWGSQQAILRAGNPQPEIMPRVYGKARF